MASYDLIVIGAGPGGYVCAIRAAQLGLKTAVRREARDPRRHLPQYRLHSVQGAAARLRTVRGGRARASPSMGIGVGTPKLDLAAMLTFKDEGVDGNVKGVEFLFKKNKVDAVHGTGRIAAPGKVEVTGDDGKTQTLETKTIVIATGSDVARAAGRRDRREAHRVVDRRAVAARACRSSWWWSAPASSGSNSARCGAGSAPRSRWSNSSTASLPGMDGEVRKQVAAPPREAGHRRSTSAPR